MCSKVDFIGCDLEGLNLKFREGAEVYLYNSTNLPKDLDVSMCSKVDMRDCDFSGVKKIKFRNKRQHDESRTGKEHFSGEIIYADEDKKEKEDSSLFSSISKRLGSGGMGE